MWILLAIGSAVFASLTAIFAKIGIEGIGSNLATAIRTMVVVVMAWIMVFVTKQQSCFFEISKRSWIFLIFSGVATGLSWLCYYKALQMGNTFKVVSIDKMSIVFTLVFAFVFLHDQMTVKSIVGCILITVGAIIIAA